MKFSENIEKVTLPGKKKLVRYYDEEGKFYRDGILLDDEDPNSVENIYHPVYPEKHTRVIDLNNEPLFTKVFENGKILIESIPPLEIHAFLETRAALLPEEHKRFISPHIYKVGVSNKLLNTRNALSKQVKQNNSSLK